MQSKIEKLANEIESWIHRFSVDSQKGDDVYYAYDEIPDSLWTFIWICIYQLQICMRWDYDMQPCFHIYISKCSNKHLLIDRKSQAGYIPKHYPEWTKYELLNIFEKFLTPFLITMTPIQINGKRRTQLTVMTDDKESMTNYGHFLQCLFPMANIRVPFCFGSHGGYDRCQIFGAHWELSNDEYMECLDLFPRWPLVMYDEWYIDVTKICKELEKEASIRFLLADLVSICLSFLRRDFEKWPRPTFL